MTQSTISNQMKRSKIGIRKSLCQAHDILIVRFQSRLLLTLLMSQLQKREKNVLTAWDFGPEGLKPPARGEYLRLSVHAGRGWPLLCTPQGHGTYRSWRDGKLKQISFLAEWIICWSLPDRGPGGWCCARGETSLKEGDWGRWVWLPSEGFKCL